MDTKTKKEFAVKTDWAHLNSDHIDQLIQLARNEDLFGAAFAKSPAFTEDISSVASGVMAQQGSAHLVAKQDCCIAGLPLVQRVLNAYGSDCFFECFVEDGQAITAGSILGTISGSTQVLLSAERIMLNLIQHLSGVATQTAAYLTAMGRTQTRLLDTRKTTPGYRGLEKYAVSCVGGWNHRRGLYDRVMFKDNHIAASNLSFSQLVKQAKAQYPGVLVEIEVDSLDQLPEAINSGTDALLLDNFNKEELLKAADLIDGRVLTEASGGIDIHSISEIANIGLDFISCGALTHQSQWRDIGMNWIK